MEEEIESCDTNLISAAPAEHDAFRSHDKVATAIVDLIKREKGGFTIGVEGAWGTGKSTIINIVGKALSKDSDIAFITYDAWAHQGDPLRRSFLERIIGVIKSKKWVDEGKWDYILGTLAKRVHKSTTTKTPIFTAEGKWFAASVLVIPGGAAILEGVIDSWPWTSDVWNSIFHVLTYLIAIALSFAPLIVLGFVLRGRMTGKPFLGFIADEQVTKEESESVDDPDPTSLEFSRKFSELLSEALGNENRKVVLIVDNLDRIQEDAAQSMWATMRTFLEYGEYERPEWFSRLWVIVPYAMESLKKALDIKQENEGAFAFIDKVFQVHFYVSPPVLSDWKDYLNTRVKQAFPRHSGDDIELHKIYRTWTQNAEHAERPTPRDLIIFINDIGALHRQWQDTFPLSHMAYYCLIRRKNADVAKQLLEGAIPTSADKELLGEDLADNVAALYFNRDVAHARQILLKPELTKLLARGESKDLNVFESKHAGLFTVLERELEPILAEWTTAETATIARAAKCLLSDDMLTRASPAEANSIKESIFDASEQISHWNPIDDDVVIGLGLAVAANGSIEYASKLTAALRGSYALSKVSERADVPDVSNWLRCYVNFIKGLKSQGLLPKIDSKLVLPGSQREWVLASQFIHDTEKSRDIIKDVSPNFDPALLAGEFLRVVQNDTFGIPHIAAIKLAIELNLNPSYQQITQAIRQRLIDTPSTPSSRAYQLLYAIWVMGKSDPSSLASEVSMAGSGHLLHYLHAAMANKDHATAALVVFLMIKDRPQLAQDAQFGNSAAGVANMQALQSGPEGFEDVAKAFTDFVEKQVDSGTVASLLQSNPAARKWLCNSISLLAAKATLERKFSLRDLFNTWTFIDEQERTQAVPPATLAKVVFALNGKHGGDLEIVKQIFGLDIARFCRAFVMQNGGISPGVLSWIEQGFDNIPSETWVTQILEDGELVHLLEEVRAKKADVRMGIKYLDALTTLADQIAGGKTPGRRPVERWSEFFDPLKHDLRISLREKVLDLAKQKNGILSPTFFMVFQQEVFTLELLKGDDEVIKKLFIPFLSRRDIPGLLLISSVVTQNKNTLDNLGPAHNITEMKDRIREALQQPAGNETDGLIKQIASQLGVTEKSESVPVPEPQQ